MDFQNLDLIQYVSKHMIILIVVLYILGTEFKKSAMIKDKYIPTFLLFLSLTIAVLLEIVNSQYKVALDVILNGLLQGVICWGIAVATNQSFKQLNKTE